GIELKCLGQRIDCLSMCLFFVKNTAEAHPGGEVGGMLCEAGVENLFGLIELIDLAQLFGKRKEKSALRIALHAKPQFLDLGVACLLSHGRKTLPQKRTAPEGAARVQTNCVSHQCVVPTRSNDRVPTFVVIVTVHVS